jgi:uncharacterized membrane protein
MNRGGLVWLVLSLLPLALGVFVLWGSDMWSHPRIVTGILFTLSGMNGVSKYVEARLAKRAVG